jgi:nitronate monooxygenase
MAPHAADMPAYPVTNALTGPLRAAAAEQGKPDLMSMWAGQGAALARGGDAGDLVRKTAAAARDIVERLRGN